MVDDSKECSDRQFISWPLPSVLIAQVAPCAEAGSNQAVGRLLFLAPTARGLEALEESELSIANIWLLASGTDNALRALQIDQISSWLTRTPAGRQLTVLHGRNGNLFAIEDERIFDLKSISTDWNGSGTYFQPWSTDSEPTDGIAETSGS